MFTGYSCSFKSFPFKALAFFYASARAKTVSLIPCRTRPLVGYVKQKACGLEQRDSIITDAPWNPGTVRRQMAEFIVQLL
jgi:hypothetical protein